MIYISSSAMRMKQKRGGGRKKDYPLLISYTCSHGRVVCALCQGMACSKLADNSGGK